MGRVKSSVYVDEDLWRRFKKWAAEQDVEISELLEELMKEELLLNVEDALLELVGERGEELDFEPAAPVDGLVSGLVREVRYDREDRLLGHERDSQEVR